MGEETDGVVASTSKLQDKLKALTGVDILTDAGAYKDTYTILKEIGEVWQNLDPMDQAAALELMAGKNRANTLAAILNNMKDLKGAYESALGAEGSALKENAAYLDSIQGRIDLFNNSVQTMWMNFMNSDVLKFIINVGTWLIKLVDSAGLLETALAGALTWLSWSPKNTFDLASLLGVHKKDANFFKGFSVFGKEGLTGAISKMFKPLPGVMDKEMKSIRVSRSSTKNLTENILGDSRDVEVTVQDFTSAIRDNLDNFVDIDTSELDTQIDSITNKLSVARKELEEAKKADWDYYKTLGSKTPAKDRDARINDKVQSVKMLEAQLDELEQKKKNVLDSASVATATTQIQAETQSYQSMLSVLSEIQGVKLSIGNEQYAAKQIDAISNAAKGGQTALSTYLATLDSSDATIGNANMALKAYAASVKDGNYSLAGFQQFIQQHNAGLQASSIAAKAAAVGHQILNAALSMGVTALASFAINAVIAGLDELIVTSEEVAEAAQEASNAIDTLSSEFKNNQETVSGLAERFAELAQGVDMLTGKNLTLTTDDYEEFLDLSNQLADIFPTLSRNYDENGNAIVQLSGDTNTIVGSLENLLDVQRRIANQEILDKVPDLYAGIIDKSRDFNKEIKQLETEKSTYLDRLNNLNSGALLDAPIVDVLLSGGGYKLTGDSAKDVQEMYSRYVDAFKSADLNVETSDIVYDLNLETGEQVPTYTIGLSNFNVDNYTEKDIEKIRNKMVGSAEDLLGEIDKIDAQIEQKKTENKANWSNMLLSIFSWLQTDSSYQVLNDDMQSMVQTIINNLDFSSLNFDSWDSLQTHIEKNILSIFTDTSSSKTVYNAISGMFDLQGKLQGNDLQLKDYKQQMLAFVKQIKESDLAEDVQQQILDMFNIDFEDNDSIGKEIDTMLNHAYSLVDKKLEDKVLTLTYSDLQIINSEHFNVDGSTIETWDQLQAEIIETKKLITKDFTTDNFAEYAESISALQTNISTYQEALESLESGTFTFTDFMALIEKFPELADGVDLSSKEFRGLSDNLRRAIRNTPDDLVDELKDLRAELLATGKSTEAIDQLIASIENMPSDAVDNLTNKYHTLADEINAAKVAQNELQKAMSENPNEGYETRGEAIEAMKTLMEEGKIGSESELWSIAKAFFGDNPKATEAVIKQNADALHDLIESRDQWYATDENGNYTYEGIESFIEYVAKNKNVLEQFKATWEYKDGQFKFDLDNEQWDAFAKALGLSSEEFSDLMVQVGQFFGITWGDTDDIVSHINKIAEGSGTASEKIDKMTHSVESYVEKALGKDLDFENLTLDGIENIKMPEGMDTKEFEKIRNLLKTYLELKEQFKDPLDIEATLDKTGLEGLSSIPDIQKAIKKNSDGLTVLDEDAFKTILTDAGYAADDIDGLIKKIQEYQQLEYKEKKDPLGLEDVNASILSVSAELDKLGISYQRTKETVDGELKIDAKDLITTLAEKGWNSESISSYIQGLSSEENKLNIELDTDNLNGQTIDEFIESATSKEQSVTLNLTGTASPETQKIDSILKTWTNGSYTIELNLNEGASSAVTQMDSDLTQLTTTSHPIKVDTVESSQKVTDLINKSNELTDTQTITANLDGNAESGIDSIESDISTLTSTEHTITIDVQYNNSGAENPDVEFYKDGETIDIKPMSTEYNVTGSGLSDLNAINEAAGQIPSAESTEHTLTGNGLESSQSLVETLGEVPQNLSTTHTTYLRTVNLGGGKPSALANNIVHASKADGTAHAQGTAYKSGSWGAEQTEESLVGELGPELRVRGNQWTLVGENGAEFTDVRKGDIIFNHKQTQSLLENGYVTGRGKAYAGGTAFASGGGKFSKYTFSDTDLTDASGKLSKAAEDMEDVADEFKEVFDWIEVRIEEITEDIDVKSAKLENTVGSSKQNAIIDDMIELNQKLYDNLTAGATKYHAYAEKLLKKIPSEYRQAAQDGSIAIESFTGEVGEKTFEAIQDYREWVQKGADATQQAEETLTEIANLAKQAIDNIASEYENKSSIPTIKIEQLEAYNSLIETTVGSESAKVYEAMMKENNKNIKILEQQRDKMQAELNAQVEAGNIKKYSQAWYDAINEIAAVDTEIIELTADTENYRDAMNELHWDHFDNIISRLEAVTDESENLVDILGSKDLVDKDTAEWTDEGITSLALYAQQMEAAEVQAQKYKEEINYLNKNWKKLGYTEQEYVEKLEELKSGQYDAIKSYNDTKEAIKDLTSERVDAIKRGIEKEISAYEELIEKKKEELDAEKD